MAGLPRRDTELPLNLRAIVLLTALLGSGAPLRAQEVPDSADLPGPDAAIEAGLRLTQIESHAVWMAGGLVQVRIRPRIHVGGAGWVMSGPVPLRGGSGTGRDLEVGYGGASISLGLPSRSVSLLGRLLMGAGNADVRDRASGTLVGSDNFGLVEATIAMEAPLGGRISFVAGGSWRAVFGVEDLPGASGGDLSGPSLVMGLRLSPL